MRETSLRNEILDQQVVDRDGLPFGRIDDIEVDLEGDAGSAGPELTRLLCSQEALGERLGGIVGGLLARTARRLRRASSPAGGFFFEAGDVDRWEPVVRLHARFRDLDAAPLETWLSDQVVNRLPGASDADQ